MDTKFGLGVWGAPSPDQVNQRGPVWRPASTKMHPDGGDSDLVAAPELPLTGAERDRRFADSPLGKAGFEPPVPLVDQYLKCQAGLTRYCRTGTGWLVGQLAEATCPTIDNPTVLDDG